MAAHPYKAHELISSVVSKFTQTAKHDGVELSVDLESGFSEVSVDKKAFTRVLGNLLGNALKFTPEGGNITVSCRYFSGTNVGALKIPVYARIPHNLLESGCFARLSVRDTGNGIPTNQLERIFDRYTQLTQKTDRERGGAGLGLAYCKLAIESFSGIIWAESEKGQGSEFVILLPCISDLENQDQRAN